MLIQSTFKPAWWLNNPHLQTIYPTFCRKLPVPPKQQRERLLTPDHDFIDLDWCHAAPTGHKQPLVMLIHGLTGSSASNYIQGLQLTLQAIGWRSVAINLRGCSGEFNNTSRCYHSGETQDLHFIYQTLHAREPNTPLAAVGFSLGGNMLLKWLGEQQQQISLFGAVAVSVPLLLNVCATKLDNGFAKLYRLYLLRALKSYIHDKQRHLAQLNQCAEAEILAELGSLHDVKSFWEYDERVIAKLYAFQDAGDYYQRSSSRQYLHAIKIPTLMIQAVDDPFMTAEVLPTPAELSSHIDLEITPAGGHVGFVTGSQPGKPEFWLEQRIPAFLQQQLQQTR